MDYLELKEKMSTWKNEYGFYCLKEHPVKGEGYLGDGNMILYTALFYCVLANLGAMTQVDSYAWQEALRQCKHEMFDMYWRTPIKKNKDDDQNHDDYWGILAASYHAFALHIPQGIYSYGDKFGWYFDIQNPGKESVKYFFGRFLNFKPFARLCSGMQLNFVDWLIIYIYSIISICSIKHSGANIRTYVRFSVIKHFSLIGRILNDIWEIRVKSTYGSIGKSFEGELPKGHPITLI